MHKVVLEAGEILKLPYTVDLTVHVRPLVICLPRSWVRVDLDLSSRTRQKVSPLFLDHFVVSLQNLHSQKQRKQKFVLFKKTSADVLVERVREILVEVF